MLGVKHYSEDHVAASRDRIARQLAAWRSFAAVRAGTDQALDELERELFANMVLALDAMFVHRLRGVEGKDGNPLNEVRVIASSLIEHGGVLTVPSSIKVGAGGTGVLGIVPGDRIELDADRFEQLAGAFLDTIAERYPPT